jgi:two-component system sensor histidine kinase/response regulator
MDTTSQIEELTQRLKEFEKENKHLHELNEKKDRIFSMLSHDLRSPFQSLLGLSEILSSEAGSMPVEEIIEFSGILNNAIKNQYELLSHVLDWARLQRNKTAFSPKRIDLFEIADKVFKIMLPVVKNKNIELVSGIKKDTIVTADEDMITVILKNLISNAIKFSHKGSTVKVVAENTGYACNISVIDNGVGLTREAIEKIFRFDSKYSDLGTEGETGLGIGLMIICEMLECHNSKLSVESEINKGSKFTFTLPEHNNIPAN